jgi:diketogulonate reductase-like aldo/keto reductase
MSALERLVDNGKIRFVGLSNFSPQEVDEAQRNLSQNRIVSDQVRYSLVDRTIEDELLQFCESRQMTVLAFSPLDNGLQNLRRLDPLDVLGQVARETGRTRAQIALNWCLNRNPVVVVFKASTVEHVRENCGASGWHLEPRHLTALNQVGFRQRGRFERLARRTGRRFLQKLGLNT